MNDLPRFLRRLRERGGRERSNKLAIKEARKGRWTRWLALYGAVVATAVTSYTAYNNFRPKEHKLDIFVSDIEVNGDIAEYGVAFYNRGDYPEIVADGSSVLGQSIDGYSAPLYWPQEQCFRPVSIKAGSAKYVRYITKFDYSKLKYHAFKSQKQKFIMQVYFDVLSSGHGIVTERVPVGTLVPYQGIKEWKGKAGYSFITREVQVDFSKARPRITKGTYPQDKEFSFSRLCNKY